MYTPVGFTLDRLFIRAVALAMYLEGLLTPGEAGPAAASADSAQGAPGGGGLLCRLCSK